MLTQSLLGKLLGINILIIGFVILIVWVAIDYLAAGYFMTLMEKYKISPTSSHEMFVSAVHRYLIWASLGAVLLAAVLSFLLMRRVLGPLRQMIEITRKISAGDYSGKVPMASRDEVGQLAAAFNRMAEGLQRIEQLRKTMVIDVAHELRTPLTNIRGYLEGIGDGVVLPSKETFDLLEEETLRLGRLVEDILNLAKADAAGMDLRKVNLQISRTILQGLDAFRPQFSAKEIKVTADFSEDAVPLPADPEKLGQVVTNLLQNAWQYTPRGETVRIFARRTPEEVRFTFSNPGGGLSQKDLPLIFERFYRGEKSRSREHGGAGIGLAIVKGLIEAHGGRVGAELSDGEVRIWFSLPINP
jgi:signal transduction histidine kinase